MKKPRAKRQSGLRFDQFRNAKGQVKKACDYNPEDPDDVAEPNDTEEEIRQRILAHHISEVKRHAEKILEQLEFADRSEIPESLFKEVQDTGMMLMRFARTINKRKFNRSNHVEEESRNHHPLYEDRTQG